MNLLDWRIADSTTIQHDYLMYNGEEKPLKYDMMISSFGQSFIQCLGLSLSGKPFLHDATFVISF
jgi:hypothetical protein